MRAFYGAMELDKVAQLGGFIVRKHITGQQRKNFEEIMGNAGVVEINGKAYPKLQMLSIREILEGKRFYMPYSVGHRSSPQLEFSDGSINP